MKIFNRVFLFSLVLFTVVSCIKNDEEYLFSGVDSAHFIKEEVSSKENEGAIPIVVAISSVNPTLTGDVTFAISETNSAAILGANFEILNTSNTLDFSSGIFDTIWVSPIDDILLEEDRIIKISLSDGSIRAGLPGDSATYRIFAVTITDDDCTLPKVDGIYSTFAIEGTGSNDCPEYAVKITDNGDGSYDLSDLTAGLYFCYYDDSDNPGTIIIDSITFEVNMIDQPDVVFGGDIFNGSGTIDCNGVITLAWSNGFGDNGVTVFSK